MHGGPFVFPFHIAWRKDRKVLGPNQPRRPRNVFREPDPETEAFRCGGLIPVSGDVSESVQVEVHRLLTLLEARLERAPSSAGESLADLTTGDLWRDPLEPTLKKPSIDKGIIAETGLRLSKTRSKQPWRTHENPFIPSGYTYLLQFIAHDLVDTTRFATIESTEPDTTAGTNGKTWKHSRKPVLAPLLANARLRPLMLDTMYGAGPDETPQCYSPDGSTATLPRTKLRTFALNKPRSTRNLRFCPYADIMRGSTPTTPVQKNFNVVPPAPVYVQPQRLSVPAPTPRTDALVADPRNDDHSIISQLLVIFHSLHNVIIDHLPGDKESRTENYVFRRFLCARFITSYIYRHILRQDVLQRILDPSVYEAYMTNTLLPLDDRPGIPVEFAAGAFRFGHAMVREQYMTNDLVAGPLPFINAREISSRRSNAANGLSDFNWAIDWALFFGPHRRVNLSRRLGPFYSSGLFVEPPFDLPIASHPKGDDGGLRDRGLASRDFFSAAGAGMWSVPALFKEIRKRLNKAGLGKLELLPRYDVWKAPLRAWLKDYKGDTAQSFQLTAEDIERLVEDPPLPFFVMFEAGCDRARGEGASREKPVVRDDDGDLKFTGNGGRHLGPLGSILVAETMVRALRSQYFGFDEFKTLLPHGLQIICEATIGSDEKGKDKDTTPHAIEALIKKILRDNPLDTMQDLLRLLRRNGVFTPPR